MPEEEYSNQNTSISEETAGYQPHSPQTIDMRPTTDFLMWTLDANATLILLEHELKGESVKLTEDKEGAFVQDWVEDKKRRVMNDDGVRWLIFTLKPYFDKEGSLSNIGTKENFGVDEAHHITQLDMFVIADTLWENMYLWGLNPRSYESLVANIQTKMYLSLTKVKGGGIAKIVKGTHQRVETIASGEKKKRGIFSFLKRPD